MKTFRLSVCVSIFALMGPLLAALAVAASEPLATVDGQAITSEEIEKAGGASLVKLQEEIYKLRRQKLEVLINERLLAKEAARRHVSSLALLDAEVTSKVGLVTEQDIEAFYQANKARLQGDEATVRQQIRGYLQNQKLEVRRQQFVDSLRSRAKVVVHLKPPPIFRAEVRINGAPSKGPVKAAVTIVKFEDFHCPFCKRAQATLSQLLARYGNKLKLVHRDFPIDSLHPEARKAHEAARCAGDQGKFWQYHDLLYLNAPKAGPDALKAYAKEVGLKLAPFERCLGEGKYKNGVEKDVEDGNRLGLTGTPAFFINGRLLSGAQPLESFASIIDDELSRVR
jgi:protein-disulfide isomerase